MQLSIIIVNYNVKAFLENALYAVQRSLAGIESEVIVVDNASDDGSVEMIQQKFPSVRLIVNENNVGFGSANNRAMSVAQGEYILLLNPDTVVQENTCSVMLDFMNSHPEVGIAGCKVLNPDGTLQLACRRSFPTPWIAFTRVVGLSTLFPASKLFGKYNLTYLNPDEPHEVDAVSGSFMIVRRQVYEQLGGFDEQFFMYGEDLDLCYRAKQAGWKIFYTPATQIIHYKGESTHRSDIDEVKLFYDAMRHFVRKHFPRNIFLDFLFHIGIAGREWIAFMRKNVGTWSTALLDFLLVGFSFMIGEYLRFGELFRLPLYAYPAIFTVPGVLTVSTLSALGLYTTRKHSLVRTFYGVIVSFILLSSLTFFFKEYAFSRIIVIISGGVSLLLVLGWRLVFRFAISLSTTKRNPFWGHRTLIVGTDTMGQEVLKKLRINLNHGYDVVGFIDKSRRRVGDTLAGVEILGSIDNISKVIKEHRISEVIFSTNAFSYADIVSVIAKSRTRSVNFRLVPNTLEVIIGKTHVDEFTDIPLVEIEYNIHKPVNRFVKRCFDIVAGMFFLLTVYPIILRRKKNGKHLHWFEENLLLLPQVIKGTMSLVGTYNSSSKRDLNLLAKFGKQGLTGLVHLNHRDDIAIEEIEKYMLYYAKNQTVWFDIKILIKTFLRISQG